MKKSIKYLFTTLLVAAFTFLFSENGFPQTDQKESKLITTASGTTPAYVSGITSGRAKSLIGGVLGLICIIVGWRSRIHSASGIEKSRTGATLAFILGFIGILLSIVHLSTSAGAVFGSGSGKAGAIVAIVLSLIGITLAGLALRNERRKNGTY